VATIVLYNLLRERKYCGSKTDVSAPIRYQIISGPLVLIQQQTHSETPRFGSWKLCFFALDIKTDCFFRKSYTVNGAPDIVAGGSAYTTLCFGNGNNSVYSKWCKR
jgi:hypothetical protein